MKIFDVSLKHSYAYRNIFDTGYKVWEIEFNLPFVGRRVNELLIKHHKSVYMFKEDSDWKNRISYVRSWYRRR